MIQGRHTTSFDLKQTNPNFSSGAEFQNNCQRCVATYEMRRRGYDVEAQPAVVTSNGRLSIKDDLANNWQSIFENARFEKVDSIDTLEKKMSEYGNGARAEVYVQWINSGAHVFVAEQINGKTLYFDPQTGKNLQKTTLQM